MFITNGVHADLYFLGAKTDPAAKGSRGISIFAVEKGTPGFRVSRALKKSGWLSSDTAELAFENCRVPAANLLGQENKGFYQIMRNFQNERMVLGAACVGEAARAIEMPVAYVRERKAFGATLWDKQAIRQRIAMLDAKTRAARAYLYHCAWLVTQGRDVVQDVSLLQGNIPAQVHVFARVSGEERLVILSGFNDKPLRVKVKLSDEVIQAFNLKAEEDYVGRDLLRSGLDIGLDKSGTFEVDLTPYTSYVIKIK